MRISRGIFLPASAALLALFFPVPHGVSQDACREYNSFFTESFASLTHIDEEGSSLEYWCRASVSPRDYATLNRLGANFDITNPAYVPGWINTIAAGDFDLDGWPDYVGSSSSYSNVLAFVRNMGGAGEPGVFRVSSWIDGSRGDATGWPTAGVGGAAIDGDGHAGLTSGDYDGDGDIDFLFIVSQVSGSFAPKRIWLYRNTIISNGIRTGAVGFVRTDLTAAWSARVRGIAWSSTMMTSVDFDGDGDIDVILGNSAAEVLKITNTNAGTVDASTFVVESTPLISAGWGGRGVSTVSVADFDGTGSQDIIIGSVSTNALRYYKNDGTGRMTLFATYTDPDQLPGNHLYDGAATVSLASDFDGDGDVDLMIGTDNWNYPSNNGGGTGYGGKVFYFKNTGSGFTQKLIFNGQLQSPQAYDFDLGVVFDYDRDGDMDFLIADGNHTQNYYVFINALAQVYNTIGTGLSRNLSPQLESTLYAITRVRFTGIDQRVLGANATGLSVEYYVSNNGGRTWELYQTFSGTNIRNASDLPWHEFRTYGSRLQWKAVLRAPADPMAEYEDASFETPLLDALELEYVYVERREYARTSAAVAATVDVEGRRTKLLLAATFFFPGMEGHLRAYDVTDVTIQSGTGSTLRTISAVDPGSPSGRYLAPGAEIAWDAGEQLRDRSPDTRAIYSAVKSGSIYNRVDFSAANVDVLGSLLGDVDGDNAGLIDFIRGDGRDWRLGDIQHSNPAVLNPPSGDPAVMGAGYDAFLRDQSGRTPVVFVGANDGMLHCFEVATGRELWGFIPYNLIPRLKEMSLRDAETGDRHFVADWFVDGSPVTADIVISGVWRTILICGQGPGKGSAIGGGLNYYFALDVTDPADPRPLWEFTHANLGETWSVPEVGKVMQSSSQRWVAFMGSGYDNDPARVVGNRFFVVRADTGASIRNVSVSNVNTNRAQHPRRYPDIKTALPGSPVAVDYNRDGWTDYVYIGDLDGRLFRMDVTGSNTNTWTLNAIYTDRMNYPIITKPAVWSDQATGGRPVHLFFGTGGDDRAPEDRPYAFLAVRDSGSGAATVDWYLGDPVELNLPAEKRMGVLGTGEKVWADPVLSDGIVYFSTLKGSIEKVNPCENLADIGRLYARFSLPSTGPLLGGTALKSSSGLAMENLQLASKARRAVTIGERQKADGTTKNEIYIQEYDSTIERLEQAAGSRLRVISWREIYKIIR